MLNNEIDIMAWPLTYPEWQTVKNDPTITAAPYYDLGDYEIAFNNNATDATVSTRKAMNYTDFRQAIACLVDKDSLISGSILNGFGTRIDTPIVRPIDNNWVNYGDSKYDANGNLINNYPWDFSELHAIQILLAGGWFVNSPYASDTATQIQGLLPLPSGTIHYPLTATAKAGLSVEPLRVYVRSDHAPRKAAGEQLYGELGRLGFALDPIHEGNSGLVSPVVFYARNYDIATVGWSFGIQPLQFWSSYTPLGIYPYGPNPYMIDDANMTYWAGLECPYAPDLAVSQAAALLCQDIIVKQAMFVTLYTSRSYAAYRTGVVGAINFRGYALTTALEYTFMNAKTAPYAAPMTLRYGTLNPPVQVNPIFSSWVWDYEVVDRIFNGPIATNPYKPTIPGKSPTGADQPWMAYDWNFQLSNFQGWANDIPIGGSTADPWNTAPHVTYTNQANVTFWFRHDITWHDGTPFTVNDWAYTGMLGYTYGDSWTWSGWQFVVGYNIIDNWTISWYFSVNSFWMLYDTVVDIVPQHIYQYIAVPADAPTGGSTTGHHGYWPGADCNASEILPGAPFTYSQLTSAGGEKYTWIGTGMWQYQVGSLSGAPGAYTGLQCTPYTGFWMKIVQADIDMNYYWYAGGGGSYKIGLADLVMLANAYGTVGKGSPTPVPFKLGGLGVWEPGCDISPPAGVVGLSDLVTLALNYGSTWGTNPGGSGGPGRDSGGQSPSITVWPKTIGGVWQNTNVTITAQDMVGNSLIVSIAINGVPTGFSTPYVFWIIVPTTFSVPTNVHGKGFDSCAVIDPTGIGIHAFYK